MQQGAREGRLAGTQVAVQVDCQARRQCARQRGAQRGGTGFVVEVGCEVFGHYHRYRIKWRLLSL